MVDMYVVNNDIADVLQSNAAATHNVNISTTPIKSFITVKDEFLREFDEHVAGKHVPQRFNLNHSITKCARPRIDSIIVRGVGDNVEVSVLAAESVLSESNAAICKSLAVVGPFRVTFPAVIYGVSG